MPLSSSFWSISTSTRSTLPVNRWSTPCRMPSGWAMMALVQAARRSLAERPSRISWVRRLAAVRASLSVASSVTPVPSRLEGVTPLFVGQRLDLRGGAVDEHHADVQRAQHRDVHQDVGEVLVGDDRAVHADDERLLAELRDVLQDAPQVGQFHVKLRLGLPSGCHTRSAAAGIGPALVLRASRQRLFSLGVPMEMRIHSGNW